jgi:hypothetical protein
MDSPSARDDESWRIVTHRVRRSDELLETLWQWHEKLCSLVELQFALSLQEVVVCLNEQLSALRLPAPRFITLHNAWIGLELCPRG